MNFSEMFVLALVQLVIIGLVCSGLLKILSRITKKGAGLSAPCESTSPGSGQPPKPPADTNKGEVTLDAILQKMNDYHKEDIERSTREKHENVMYIAWGFALASVSLALSELSLRSSSPTSSNFLALVVSILVSVAFMLIGFYLYYLSRRRV